MFSIEINIFLPVNAKLAFNVSGGDEVIGSIVVYTAKTKYRNFETNIPRKGISGSQSQFPYSCVCARFKYSKIGLPILLEEICRPIRASLTEK